MTPRSDSTSPPVPADWATRPDEDILDLRLSDLPIAIEGSWLEGRIEALYAELAARGLSFRPHFWLSAEWFSPDGVPGVAIPFYLAHPRLMRLENAEMLEVEGGEQEWCMKILRHEAGHAFDNAYDLRRRRTRRRIFGSPNVEYPEFYLPRPYSKSFVLHLDSWYAQSHPDEDFAETFAVWMTPGSDWRNRYHDWPALRKLEYVESLMTSIAGQAPINKSRRRVEPLNTLRRTLRAHYQKKREHYGLDHPNFTDKDLRRLFSDDDACAANLPAATFIQRIRRDARRLVSEWTGSYQYTIDQVIEDMIDRCRELKLRLKFPEDRTKMDFMLVLTVQTMNHLHSGRHRMAL